MEGHVGWCQWRERRFPVYKEHQAFALAPEGGFSGFQWISVTRTAQVELRSERVAAPARDEAAERVLHIEEAQERGARAPGAYTRPLSCRLNLRHFCH